jgi:hypothetical protein
MATYSAESPSRSSPAKAWRAASTRSDAQEDAVLLERGDANDEDGAVETLFRRDTPCPGRCIMHRPLYHAPAAAR